MMDKQLTITSRFRTEGGWVMCPYCHKKQFRVHHDTEIRNFRYKCRGSNCHQTFEVNILDREPVT